MEINYRLKYRDLLWLNLYMQPRIKMNQIAYAVFMVFSVILGILLMNAAETELIKIIIGAIIVSIILQINFIIVMLIFLLFYPLLGHYQKLMKDDITITITEKEYREETAFGTHISPWKKIQKIIETDFYIVILCSDINGNIIPNRIFKNNNDAHAFCVYAKKQLFAAMKK